MLLTWGGLGGSVSAQATPRACLEAASAQLRRPLRPLWRGFLDQGDVGKVFLPPPRSRGGCVGALLVAPPRLAKLRVRLLSPSGLELRRREARGHLYLRYCGRGGERLVVRAVQGRGEVRLALLEGEPPLALPDLNGRVGACFAGGGVERPLAEVGNDPRLAAGAGIGRALQRWRRRIGERGYELASAPLASSESGRMRVPLGGRLARCGGVLLVGSGALHDVDLLLRDEAGDVLGRDVTGSRDAWVPLCGEDAERAAFAEVRVARGRGRWALFLATIRPPQGGDVQPPGLQDRVVHRWWEAMHRARARGFRVVPLGWVHLPRGGAYRWPVELPGPGRCALFGAVPGEATRRADLDVVLSTEDGQLLAADLDPRRPPRVILCGAPSARGWLHVRAGGGAGGVLLWWSGEEAP